MVAYMSQPIPASDYNNLCAFLGTGIKGQRPSRPTEYRFVATDWQYVAGIDNYGSFVTKINPANGAKDVAWVGAEGSTLAEAEAQVAVLVNGKSF